MTHRYFYIVALQAEGQALIDRYKLKKSAHTGITLYDNESVFVLITGIGQEKAMIATTIMCTLFKPSPLDMIINLGICGAKETFRLGQTLLAHQIISEKERRYYPHIIHQHPFSEVSLHSLDHVVTQTNRYDAVDMESYAVTRVAKEFVSSKQVVVIKVVSDHFSETLPTKEQVMQWINSALDDIIVYVERCSAALTSRDAKVETTHNQLVTQLKLTKAQSDKLLDALHYHFLRFGTIKVAEQKKTASKNERSRVFESLIQQLTA